MSDVHGLNGQQFVHLMRAGHRRLQANVQAVNALNIFPVPDGDTGTNMELSLRAGIAKLDDQRPWTPEDAAHALATGLLMGARGNSGVILSQLFRGFLKAAKGKQTLSVHDFAIALQEGVQIAYRAVAKPVEGTILTVAREAAAAGVREAKLATDLAVWLKAVHDAAMKALLRTPDQLPVLKQAGVVDSGGQGFVYILAGFVDYFRDTADVPETSPVAINHMDFAAAHVQHETAFGYCTEVLIRTEHDAAHAEASLRETLSAYGDSLLVVGVDPLVKVHVHTLEPGRVLQDSIQFGPLVKIKIENMTEQHADIVEQARTAEVPQESKPERSRQTAVVAVCAGEGLRAVYESLGVDVIVSGGQTLNPSTEEIVEAIRGVGDVPVVVLPNNKNVYMAADQACQVVENGRTEVVHTPTMLHGIAALMSFRDDLSQAENARRMSEAAQKVQVGQIVRAVRDSVYQDRAIKADQYLGFVDEKLHTVADERAEVARELLHALHRESAELVTVFYGSDVSEEEVQCFAELADRELGLDVEARFGGQPVYDYMFTVE